MKKILLLSFFLFFLHSLSCFAFKVDTHVWIGQQVLNDLTSCRLNQSPCITVKLGEETLKLPVKQKVAEAIINHPSAYRLGNIGPDAFPSIYMGQMTIHPGDHDWGTGEFLEHLLDHATTKEEVAFTYGFLGHAAADTFAHTYVNTYSGNVFSLMDGEMDVEKRHTILESFISQFNPPLQDSQGNFLGKPYEVIRNGKQLAVPLDFLSKTLLWDDQVKYAKAPGIDAIRDLRKTLIKIRNSDELHFIEDLIQKSIIQRTTGIKVSDEQLQKINETYDKFMARYENETTKWLLDRKEEINEQTIKFLQTHNRSVGNILDEFNRAIGKLQEAIDHHDKAFKKFLDQKHKLEKIPGEICDNICREVCRCTLFNPLGCVRRLCDDICERSCSLNPAHKEETKIFNLYKEAKDEAFAEIKARNKDVKKALTKATEITKNIILTEQNLSRAAIETLQSFNSLRPLDRHLKLWVEEIENAMKMYMVANGEAIANSITPDGNFAEPMKNWILCYAPGIIGLPTRLTGELCQTVGRVKEIIQQLKELERLLFPTFIQNFLKAKDNILAEIEGKAKESIIEELMKMDKNAATIWEMFMAKPTDELMTRIFVTDSTQVGLLPIPDIVQRVLTDMGKDAAHRGQSFDINNFSVIYNAVLLAKLSLLDQDSLNLLAQMAGVNHSVIYGPQLFNSHSRGNNILVGSLKSIDGNHQWLQKAPPYLRREGKFDHDWESESREFSFQLSEDLQAGFRMYVDPQARQQMFLKLFSGPLVPSIEAPNNFNLSSIVPESFREFYDVSMACPYPQVRETCPLGAILFILTR